MSAAAPRVLFIAPSAYPLGGVQTWLDYVLPGLAQMGWEPLLGLVSGVLHDTSQYLAAHPGHRYTIIDNPTGSPEGRVRALMASISRTRPDLVVSVNVYDCYEAVARLRTSGATAPRIAMADHSLEPDFLIDAIEHRDVIDGFIGTNRLSTVLALRQGIAPDVVHYAPYGVPPTKFLPRAGREADGLLRIGYSGRLDQDQKRADDIAGVVDALHSQGVQFHLRVAGGGPALAQVRERLREHEASGRVAFLGVLAAADLQHNVYLWADALLVTSFWETGPIVIWEAMACGLPVVSARYVGSGAEAALAHDVNCLLFDIGDREAAAYQLARLRDANLRVALAQQGLRLVQERYTRARSIEEWDKVLRAILARQATGHAPQGPARAASGRLDRLLGVRAGETVRRLAGRRFKHSEPGGEWPHTGHALSPRDEQAHWRLAQEVDAA